VRTNHELKQRRRLNECLIRCATLGMLAMSSIACATPRRTAPPAIYTLVPSAYGMELKPPDGRVIFVYMTKKPENIGLTSPSTACFYPVNTPSGERVTSIAPNDHPHHRGIFLGWQNSEFHEPVDVSTMGPHHPIRALKITRTDFWGWGQYAPRDGRVIVTKEIKLIDADAEHATLAIHNDWMVDNRKMLEEDDRVSVKEQEGVFVIDLDYHLAPIADYVLNQSGFGGFALQGRKDGESYYANAAGKVTMPDPHYAYPESDWPDAPWYDFTIQLKDSGKIVGAAVINSTSNPETTWHNASYLWMLNPSITGDGPYTIHPKSPLELQYRVVVHDGPTPTSLLEKLTTEWMSR
jgi:Methane oxygenase PmoA